MFVLTWCSFHLALDRLVFIPLGVHSLGVPSLGVHSLGVNSQHLDFRKIIVFCPECPNLFKYESL